MSESTNRIQTQDNDDEIGYDINTGSQTNLSLLLKKRKRLILLLILIIVIYLVIFLLSSPTSSMTQDDNDITLNSSQAAVSSNELNKLVKEAIEKSQLSSDQLNKIYSEISLSASSDVSQSTTVKETSISSSSVVNSHSSSDSNINTQASSINDTPISIEDRIKNILASDPIITTDDYIVYQRFHRNDIDFTQGLYFDSDTTLIESTGLNKRSKLKKYDFFNPMNIYWSLKLEDDYFGEGCDQVGDTIYQLTYKNKVILKYKASDINTLQSTLSRDEIEKLHNVNPNLTSIISQDKEIVEGWGITHDDKKFYISDSTSTVKIVDINDPDFKVIGKLNIRKNGINVQNLNELEFANGKIYGNIWYKDHIVIINPENGEVEKQIDFTNLVRYEKNHKNKGDDMNVLNGIAYNKRWDFFILTGKNWTGMYFVKFK